MNRSASLPGHVWVDCYGLSFRDEIHVCVKETKFSFIYNPRKKIGKSFSLGIYHDHAVGNAQVNRYPLERRIALLLESPITIDRIEHQIDLSKRFQRIYTHRKSRFGRGLPFRPLYYGTSWIECGWEQEYEKRKLVSFIGSIAHPDEYGYRLRKQVASICLNDKRVDCFGKGVRPIDSKLFGLVNYAFSIAMENVQEDYYFTEKLIDCFLTETVPIYFGSPGICDIFDSRGMILFGSVDELKTKIASISIEKYHEMLPHVIHNKNIAIQNNWATLNGIYQRLAESLYKESLGFAVSPWERLRYPLRTVTQFSGIHWDAAISGIKTSIR